MGGILAKYQPKQTHPDLFQLIFDVIPAFFSFFWLGNSLWGKIDLLRAAYRGGGRCALKSARVGGHANAAMEL